MGINFHKGSVFDFAKQAPGLKKIIVGLGWDCGTEQIDLDAVAIVLGQTGKLLSDEYFVFYNNLVSPDGAIKHSGDNRTGKGDGDDEVIGVNISNINDTATEIIFAVSIHDNINRKQSFSSVKNSYIRLVDTETKIEIGKYILDKQYQNAACVTFAKLQKKNSEWYFYAIGESSQFGLQEFLNQFL